MNNDSIVFFGAGPVAAKSLELLSQKFIIEAVITKGPATKKIEDYPVIIIAEKIKSKVVYTNNRQEVDAVITNNSFNSKLGVLIDFGVIVSERTINSFPLGIVNSHFSLLPEWRGADPITYSLLSGQEYTGVTLMMLSKGMDEGPILSQEKIKIENDDTGTTLTDKLILLSDRILKKSLPLYLEELVEPVDQIEFANNHGFNSKPTYSQKINKKDGEINWHKPAIQIEREIRAYQPWPRSFTKIGENLVISVSKARVMPNEKLNAGKIDVRGDSLLIGTTEGAIELLEVQPAGKNKMQASDFIRGYLNKLFVQVD